MLFQEVRHVGPSLLASAGILGIIGGIAAQKTLANVMAGFQIALAQPVRQDDVVVVEGEWGRVEEITLTYVIVHIWDDRRLILPLDLRCEIREKFMDFIQKHQPDTLPKLRAYVTASPGNVPAGDQVARVVESDS